MKMMNFSGRPAMPQFGLRVDLVLSATCFHAVFLQMEAMYSSETSLLSH
jgi:hypothetical protein